MNKLFLLTPLLLITSLYADKDRDRWIRDKQQRKELMAVYYKVATVSGLASFIGGSAAAWLFYYIQSKRGE